MHDMLKKKNMQRKLKAKKIKMLLNMVASMFLRCGSYMIYLEGNSPHQVVMIVCELKRSEEHTSELQSPC